MENITVVDSIMGSGKTTWAIEKMKKCKDDKFIYITPYLDEIKRIKSATQNSRKMYEPMYVGGSKSSHFHKMLCEGKDICSTHALFQNANQVTREALNANDYILVLDEVMDVVEPLKLSKQDLKMLIDNKFAYIEGDYLLWSEEERSYTGEFEHIKNMALNRNIIYIGDKLLFWNFPVDIFSYFKEVYILTYMFDAQIQKYYYDFHNIKYKRFQVDSNHELVTYTKEREIEGIKKIRGLIDIYEGKLNKIGDAEYSLSKTWFERRDKTLSKMFKNNLVNWFNNINKDYKAKARMWTTFKDSATSLGGQGYTKRFVSLNVRSTNEYIDSAVLAYCCNRYVNPLIKTFFNKRGIVIDESAYALSEMVQWIWRSRIRRGERIYLYVPSERMRNMLKEYLMLD